MSNKISIAGITLVAHPPEHRRGRSAPAQAGPGCCCCCCCCLHTIGGIVGAVIAPRMGQKPLAWSHLSLMEEWDDEDYQPRLATLHQDAITEEVPAPLQKPADSSRPSLGAAGIALSGTRPSAVSIFWWTLLILVVGGSGLFGVVARGGDNVLSGVGIAGFTVVMLFPCVQIAAAIVAAIILGVSDRPDRRYQLRQLAKIFVGAVGGAVAGVLVMLGLALPFAGLSEGSALWILGVLIGAGVFFAIYFSLVKAGLDRLGTMTAMAAMVACLITLGGLYAVVGNFGWLSIAWLFTACAIGGAYMVLAAFRWVDHFWVLTGSLAGLFAMVILGSFGPIEFAVDVFKASGLLPMLAAVCIVALAGMALTRWYLHDPQHAMSKILGGLLIGMTVSLFVMSGLFSIQSNLGGFFHPFGVGIALGVPAVTAWLFLLLRRFGPDALEP